MSGTSKRCFWYVYLDNPFYMKKAIFFLFLLLLLAGGLWWYFIGRVQGGGDAFVLVPEDAVYVLETDHPVVGWQKMSSSLLWTHLKKHPYFKEITEDANYLDITLHNNKNIFKWVGRRKTLISAHMIQKRDYDFLFTIQVEQALRSAAGRFLTEKIFTTQGYELLESEFEGKNIQGLKSPDDGSILYLVNQGDFIQCSYTKELIHRAIRRGNSAQEAELFQPFAEVSENVSSDGPGRLHVNYYLLDDLMGCYTQPVDPYLKDLSVLLGPGCYDIQLDKEQQWDLKGETVLNDSENSYLSAFLKSGQGERNAHKLVSNRAAAMVNFSFNGFERFYAELQQGIATNEKIKNDLDKYTRQMERLLNVRIREDVLGWVGNEMAFVQMKPTSYSQSGEDLAVCIRASSEGKATEQLDKLHKQVKRRTPGKIQQYRFGNYNIHYLGIKGLFRALFGRLFSKLETPYYVQIEDWVVFSQSPRTLIGLIEDYESGRTLESDPGFMAFNERFKSSGSIFAYSNLDISYDLMGKRLDPKSRKKFSKSIRHMQHIRRFGLLLGANGTRIDTHASLNITPPGEGMQEQLSENELEEIYREKLEGTALDSLSETERYVAQNLNEDELVVYYPDSKQVFYRCELKKRKFHGRYEEFYPSGQIRVEGSYRKGRKTGTWNYFDPEGNLIKKQKFSLLE